jgi:catechol 2,3-dioxygenase-like lactoylglutathione lyase family enzyme
VDTGSRQENASNQESRAPFRFNRNGKGSGDDRNSDGPTRGPAARTQPADDKIEWFTADHETAGSDDLCFLTASTPEQVAAHLKAHGVTIEEGPVNKQGARGVLRSVYCRDPDGSLIEISSYQGEAS